MAEGEGAAEGVMAAEIRSGPFFSRRRERSLDCLQVPSKTRLIRCAAVSSRVLSESVLPALPHGLHLRCIVGAPELSGLAYYESSQRPCRPKQGIAYGSGVRPGGVAESCYMSRTTFMRRLPRVSLSRRVRPVSSPARSFSRVEPLEGRQLLSAELISVNLAGNGPGNGDSREASVSGDGRYVVFTSTSTDLVANDTNGKSDIFLRDRLNNTTTLISKNPTTGEVANDESFEAKINNDGTFVVFASRASNLDRRRHPRGIRRQHRRLPLQHRHRRARAGQRQIDRRVPQRRVG